MCFRAISGLDDFSVAAAEGWLLLKNISNNLSIDADKKRNILDRIEESCLYLKASYSIRCSNTSECSSHCPIFALSHPNQKEFFETCSHQHNVYCKGNDYTKLFILYSQSLNF